MLTEKQKEILNIIQEYINSKKISPTVREIGKISGLTSTSTIHGYLKRLEEKGYISRLDNSPRSIVVNYNGK